PRQWRAGKLSVREASTRWGPVDLDLQPSPDLRRITARITLESPAQPTIMLRVRHPQRLRITSCKVTGGTCDEVDAERELVRLRPRAKTAIVDLDFHP
ncbi:MAG: hypothetical protein HQ582_16250, partial [Planctomycetes bacterium]|nr:hypothetical protein [Planctomycetota bacterium]